MRSRRLRNSLRIISKGQGYRSTAFYFFNMAQIDRRKIKNWSSTGYPLLNHFKKALATDNSRYESPDIPTPTKNVKLVANVTVIYLKRHLYLPRTSLLSPYNVSKQTRSVDPSQRLEDNLLPTYSLSVSSFSSSIPGRNFLWSCHNIWRGGAVDMVTELALSLKWRHSWW